MKKSKYNLSKEATNYRPQSISKEYCNKVLTDMILNNMKIEGQEVNKSSYLKFKSEMQEQSLNENG